MLRWLKRIFESTDLNAGTIQKKLYHYCKKYRKKIGCKDCPVNKECHIFLVATSNLYFALIDAMEPDNE